MKFILLNLMLLNISIIFAQTKNIIESSEENDKKYAPRRMALLIGVQDYESVSKLKNIVNDIDTMEHRLKLLNFDIIKVVNPDLKAFKETVEKFKNKITNTAHDEILFYYSGHGVQAENINFLIPRDFKNVSDEKYENKFAYFDKNTVTLDTILQEINIAKAQYKIVFLDACREDIGAKSLSASSIRSMQIDASKIKEQNDLFIFYSVTTGKTASDGTKENLQNSVFTHCIKNEIIKQKSFAEVVENINITCKKMNQIPYTTGLASTKLCLACENSKSKVTNAPRNEISITVDKIKKQIPLKYDELIGEYMLNDIQWSFRAQNFLNIDTKPYKKNYKYEIVNDSLYIFNLQNKLIEKLYAISANDKTITLGQVYKNIYVGDNEIVLNKINKSNQEISIDVAPKNEIKIEKIDPIVNTNTIVSSNELYKDTSIILTQNYLYGKWRDNNSTFTFYTENGENLYSITYDGSNEVKNLKWKIVDKSRVEVEKNYDIVITQIKKDNFKYMQNGKVFEAKRISETNNPLIEKQTFKSNNIVIDENYLKGKWKLSGMGTFSFLENNAYTYQLCEGKYSILNYVLTIDGAGVCSKERFIIEKESITTTSFIAYWVGASKLCTFTKK